MNAYAVFDAASFLEPDNVQAGTVCISCRERSYLHKVAAELLYKNQLLRFKLSESQALLCQLRITFCQMQARPGFAMEFGDTLNVLNTLLDKELEG